MPRRIEEDDNQPTTAWNGNPEENGEYVPSEQMKHTLSPFEQTENNQTPTLPKKVSFAAEVDEQQEKLNKDNSRRDVCCSIQ